MCTIGACLYWSCIEDYPSFDCGHMWHYFVGFCWYLCSLITKSRHDVSFVPVGRTGVVVITAIVRFPPYKGSVMQRASPCHRVIVGLYLAISQTWSVEVIVTFRHRHFANRDLLRLGHGSVILHYNVLWGCNDTGLNIVLRPANERRRYFVTPSLIGWAQNNNHHCNDLSMP